MWLGTNRSDWLGTWTTDQPVVLQKDFDTTAALVLALTDEQLAIIEQRRAGGDLQLGVDVHITLGYDPDLADASSDDRWPSKTWQEQITVQGESWVRLLNQAAAGMSLAIVVQVTLGSGAPERVGFHLRDAIRKVNLGEYGDAATSARKALEATDRAWTPESAVTQIGAKNRTVEQRLSMLRHASFSLASLGPHDDPVAAGFAWTRESALAVIAAVSALAAVAFSADSAD